MQIKTLLASMLVNETNMRVLHWMVRGKGFQNAHAKVTSELYERIRGDIDVVAEAVLRLDDDAVDYISAVSILKDSDEDVIIVKADRTYDAKTVYVKVDEILGQILELIGKTLASEEIKRSTSVGIKATLEGIYEYYDVQKNYLNKCRLSDYDD